MILFLFGQRLQAQTLSEWMENKYSRKIWSILQSHLYSPGWPSGLDRWEIDMFLYIQLCIKKVLIFLIFQIFEQ